MKTKDGKQIVSCVLYADTRNAECVSCAHYRNWVNYSFLHEGDEPFCDCTVVTTKE